VLVKLPRLSVELVNDAPPIHTGGREPMTTSTGSPSLPLVRAICRSARGDNLPAFPFLSLPVRKLPRETFTLMGSPAITDASLLMICRIDLGLRRDFRLLLLDLLLNRSDLGVTLG
jgi:hypothetical protein